MTPKSTKLIVLIILLIHGIGHIQGVLTGLGIKTSRSANSHSWLLSNNLGYPAARFLCFSLYLASAILGLITAFCFRGIIDIHISWQNMALYMAMVSATALVLFPNALAFFFNKIGAAAVNIITLLSIFWLQWPPEIFNE